jgi:hypothetical protein
MEKEKPGKLRCIAGGSNLLCALPPNIDNHVPVIKHKLEFNGLLPYVKYGVTEGMIKHRHPSAPNPSCMIFSAYCPSWVSAAPARQRHVVMIFIRDPT